MSCLDCGTQRCLNKSSRYHSRKWNMDNSVSSLQVASRLQSYNLTWRHSHRPDNSWWQLMVTTYGDNSWWQHILTTHGDNWKRQPLPVSGNIAGLRQGSPVKSCCLSQDCRVRKAGSWLTFTIRDTLGLFLLLLAVLPITESGIKLFAFTGE